MFFILLNTKLKKMKTLICILILIVGITARFIYLFMITGMHFGVIVLLSLGVFSLIVLTLLFIRKEKGLIFKVSASALLILIPTISILYTAKELRNGLKEDQTRRYYERLENFN